MVFRVTGIFVAPKGLPASEDLEREPPPHEIAMSMCVVAHSGGTAPPPRPLAPAHDRGGPEAIAPGSRYSNMNKSTKLTQPNYVQNRPAPTNLLCGPKDGGIYVVPAWRAERVSFVFLLPDGVLPLTRDPNTLGLAGAVKNLRFLFLFPQGVATPSGHPLRCKDQPPRTLRDLRKSGGAGNLFPPGSR